MLANHLLHTTSSEHSPSLETDPVLPGSLSKSSCLPLRARSLTCGTDREVHHKEAHGTADPAASARALRPRQIMRQRFAGQYDLRFEKSIASYLKGENRSRS